MGIESVGQFLKVTSPQNLGVDKQLVAFHQGRSEGTYSNPYSNRDIFSNIEELESRKAGKAGSLLSSKAVNTASLSQKGSIWDGFNVPQNNGTGELMPVVDGKNWLA